MPDDDSTAPPPKQKKRKTRWGRIIAKQLGPTLLAAVTLYVVYLTKHSIDVNAPKPRHTVQGAITAPHHGYDTDPNAATSFMSKPYVCGLAGTYRYLPADYDLWLVVIKYYSGIKQPQSGSLSVHVNPALMPVKLDGHGRWSYVGQSQGKNCQALYVGGTSLPAETRFAIDLIEAPQNVSLAIREYNVGKGKCSYPGFSLPTEVRILDELDVIRTPSTAKNVCPPGVPR